SLERHQPRFILLGFFGRSKNFVRHRCAVLPASIQLTTSPEESGHTANERGSAGRLPAGRSAAVAAFHQDRRALAWFTEAVVRQIIVHLTRPSL
ncbi:MAG: hypothetical protein NZ823_00600, partial [Blastocatellia bacterium]|nr:hypothetical protein [Blastocatellia bacterium]